MSQRTTLYEKHLEANAKIIDFAGWEMPIHYGSQIDEHHTVRQSAGMFDVSHMVVIDFHGAQVQEFLRYLLANDVAKLKLPGKALYSCMLNEQGGVIDDLIVYYLADNFYRMVVNAATSQKDIAWIKQKAGQYDVTIKERDDLSMIAVQGPEARSRVLGLLSTDDQEVAAALKPFFGAQLTSLFVARTGYTGEDGFEIIVENSAAQQLWQSLLDAGVAPIGLGARDTLRLEAGMNLYGTDMDEAVTPLVSGLSWTVAWDPEERDFIGRAALEAEKEDGVEYRFVGLYLKQRGVLRGHQKIILPDGGVGEVTSGTFSPTLQNAIAMARVPANADDHCEVEIRGKRLPATIVKLPFVRQGKVLIDI